MEPEIFVVFVKQTILQKLQVKFRKLSVSSAEIDKYILNDSLRP